MAQTNPIRGTTIHTKKWSGVDTDGQEISFDTRCLAVIFTVYVASGTTLSDNFVVTAPSTSAHTDDLTIPLNPFPMSVSKKAGEALCTIAATSGTIDIHALVIS